MEYIKLFMCVYFHDSICKPEYFTQFGVDNNHVKMQVHCIQKALTNVCVSMSVFVSILHNSVSSS